MACPIILRAAGSSRGEQSGLTSAAKAKCQKGVEGDEQIEAEAC